MRLSAAFVYLVAASSVSLASYAAPITVPCTPSGCTASIAQGPGGDFTTNSSAYTLITHDNGGYFRTTLTTTDPAAAGAFFANIYFDTDTSNPTLDHGSNLGFEVTNDQAFIPGVSGYYSLAGTGITETKTVSGGVYTINQYIPNNFFLNDPTGIGFDKTISGGEVTVHYSQSFGYGFVGGSGAWALPNELGGAIVTAASPVPEPASLQYMAIAGMGVLGYAGRKVKARFKS